MQCERTWLTRAQRVHDSEALAASPQLLQRQAPSSNASIARRIQAQLGQHRAAVLPQMRRRARRGWIGAAPKRAAARARRTVPSAAVVDLHHGRLCRTCGSSMTSWWRLTRPIGTPAARKVATSSAVSCSAVSASSSGSSSATWWRLALAAGKARVDGQLGLAQALAQRRELVGLRRHRRDMAVARAVGPLADAELRERGRRVGDEEVVVHRVRPLEGQRGIEHRQLAARMPWPLRSRANSAALMACAAVSALSLSHTVVASSVGSPVAWLGCERRHARHRLDHRVVDAPAGIGPGLAEAGDRRIDQARVGGAQRGGVQPQPRHRAGAEVLHQHVGAARQLAHHLPRDPCASGRARSSACRGWR